METARVCEKCLKLYLITAVESLAVVINNLLWVEYKCNCTKIVHTRNVNQHQQTSEIKPAY